MDPFDDEGVFWLPETANPVSGHLSFDGEAFALSTDATLAEVAMLDGEEVPDIPEWVVHPVILGRLRDRGEVTLLSASGVPGPPFHANAREEWSASAALLGSHVAEPVFSRATFSFDVLVSWAKPPSLVSWDTETIGTVDLAAHELERATINDVTVRLTANWNGQAGGDVVDVHRRCWIRVGPVSLGLSDLLDEWVRPMQDLMIVLLGRPVRLTDLRVVPETRVADQAVEESHQGGREESVRVVFGGLMAASGADVSWSSLRNWGTPTMFVREDLPVEFADLVKGWFNVRDVLGEAITLLCSPFYAPFMYSEHRYAATFQSAESIARVKYAGPERVRHEHRSRVAAVVAAARAAGIADETLVWAEAVLNSKNDKTLRQLTQELIADAGVLGEKVLECEPDFARVAATARSRVSHPGGHGLSAEQSYWYEQTLLWLVRARLAVEAGIPLDVLAEQVLRRGHFAQTIERLQPSRTD